MTKTTTLLFEVFEDRFGTSAQMPGIMDSCLPGIDVFSVLARGGLDQEAQVRTREFEATLYGYDFDPAAAVAYSEPWPGSEAVTSAQCMVNELSHRGLIVDPADTAIGDVCGTNAAACWPCPDLD